MKPSTRKKELQMEPDLKMDTHRIKWRGTRASAKATLNDHHDFNCLDTQSSWPCKANSSTSSSKVSI